MVEVMKKAFLRIMCGLLLVVTGVLHASEELVEAASSRENDFLPVGGWPITDEVRAEHERCMVVLKTGTRYGQIRIEEAIPRLARLAICHKAFAPETVSCLTTNVVAGSVSNCFRVAAAINSCAAIVSVHRELVPVLLVALVQLTKCVKNETVKEALIEAFTSIAVAVGRADESVVVTCINGIAACIGPLALPQPAFPVRERFLEVGGASLDVSGGDPVNPGEERGESAHRALAVIAQTVPGAAESCFDALRFSIRGGETYGAWQAIIACVEKGPVSDEMLHFLNMQYLSKYMWEVVEAFGLIGSLHPEHTSQCFDFSDPMTPRGPCYAGQLCAIGAIAASNAEYADRGLNRLTSAMGSMRDYGDIHLVAVALIGCAHEEQRERCWGMIVGSEMPQKAFEALGELGSRVEAYAERCVTNIETCLSGSEWFVERGEALVPLGRIGGAYSAYTERCLVLIAKNAHDLGEYSGLDQAAVALRYLIDGKLIQGGGSGEIVINNELYDGIVRCLQPYLDKKHEWAQDVLLYMNRLPLIYEACRANKVVAIRIAKYIASFCAL